MVEDDITIHPQNSLNSGYQGYTKPFYIKQISFFKYYDYICATNKKIRPYDRSVKRTKTLHGI